jgi:hypothetical protein
MTIIGADEIFFQELCSIDHAVSLEVKAKGCLLCKAPLDTSNFKRKPRGLGENEEIRFSLCCRREGCRKRVTTRSLRFFGRKVYSALTVIVAINFYTSLCLRSAVARKTIARWKSFWKDRLHEGHPFMRNARSFLLPGFQVGPDPTALLFLFKFPEISSLIPILRFFLY